MIKWTLKHYLEANDLSAYRLVQTAKVSPTTVYALARGDHERVSLEVLDKVLAGLEQLTGKPAEIGDLLVREPDEATEQPTRKKTWRDLAGAFDDPDSPGDVAINHDKYLGEALSDEYDRMTLQGER